MADSGNPVSKYAVKWQLALAVGLPVAFGVGYWYLITKGKKKSIREFDGNNKITHHETSIDVEKSTKGRVESLPKVSHVLLEGKVILLCIGKTYNTVD